MPDVTVRHEEGDRFRATIRGHQLVIDQPVEDGGTDAGPTPTELFVAGLASCVAFYAERYLRRHHLPVDGLAVDCTYAFGPVAPVGSDPSSAWCTRPASRHPGEGPSSR